MYVVLPSLVCTLTHTDYKAKDIFYTRQWYVRVWLVDGHVLASLSPCRKHPNQVPTSVTSITPAGKYERFAIKLFEGRLRSPNSLPAQQGFRAVVQQGDAWGPIFIPNQHPRRTDISFCLTRQRRPGSGSPCCCCCCCCCRGVCV